MFFSSIALVFFSYLSTLELAVIYLLYPGLCQLVVLKIKSKSSSFWIQSLWKSYREVFKISKQNNYLFSSAVFLRNVYFRNKYIKLLDIVFIFCNKCNKQLLIKFYVNLTIKCCSFIQAVNIIALLQEWPQAWLICFFVCCLAFRWKILRSNGNINIAGKGCNMSAYVWHFMPLIREGDLYRVTFDVTPSLAFAFTSTNYK